MPRGETAVAGRVRCSVAHAAALVLACWGLGAWGAGCAAQHESSEADDGPQIRAVGAGAAGFRATPFGRGAFDPLELPTPTEARLGSGAPGPAYWQQRADYKIDVALDADARRVRGRATITYTNNAPHTLDHVWLHLEQNLYRADSIGARAGSEDFGLGGVPKDFVGGLEIGTVRVDGADATLHVFDTLGRIDLDKPLAARGGKVAIEVAWSFVIPPNGSDRMGLEETSDGPIFQLAQWFPAIAKYDDVEGWNTLPYMSVGEFYTDFGDYEVAITVPRDHIVGATGVLQNEPEVLTGAQRERLARARTTAETVAIVAPDEVGSADARPGGEAALTWRYRAENVRTFAWASSRAFVWDAAAVGGDASKQGGTLAMSLYPRDAMPLWSESTDMLRFAIEDYNAQWHPYPYPIAINVNGIVPGMEYPMIIFCAERRDRYDLYSVTTHEIGHNWFPMMVNTDERRHAWMDEGFNTFINYYSEIARLGEIGRYYDFESWLANFAGENLQPMATMPDRMWAGNLGWLAYDKPAWMLIVLRERVLGPDRFDAAFRAYIRRWAFKSPQPADFFRTMEEVSGMDLAWFWRAWVYSTGTLDQGIESVWIADDLSEARITVASHGNGDEIGGDAAGADTMFMPVHLRVTFDDGLTADLDLPAEIWTTSSVWTTSVRIDGRRVSRVEIDPDGALPDMDRSDNIWEP